MIARHSLVLGLTLLLGCGVTRLQSARTTPRGLTRTTIGPSLVHLGDRGFTLEGVPAIPLDIMVRHGATGSARAAKNASHSGSVCRLRP